MSLLTLIFTLARISVQSRPWQFIIAHNLKIGSGSLIAWGCEFLDDDWHTLEYADQHRKEPGIKIGRKVWVGSQVTILKGVRIPDGCVVAA